MRNFSTALLLVIILAFSLFFSGCSSIGNVSSQNTNVKIELEERGGLRAVLTPKNIKEKKPSEDQYEAAIAIMDYRLKSIGYDKKAFQLTIQETSLWRLFTMQILILIWILQ